MVVMGDLLLALLAWVALAVAVAAAWSAIATAMKRRSPAPRDNGERPDGHHAGERWRTKPPGDWHPDRDDREPDQPPALPEGVDGEQLGRQL